MATEGPATCTLKLYTNEEAAACLRTSTRNLNTLRRKGKIAYIRDGSRPKYTQAQLDAYLRAREVPVKEEC